MAFVKYQFHVQDLPLIPRTSSPSTIRIHSFPTEISLEILSFLKPNGWIKADHRKELVSLALVCRVFYSEVLPWCFECFVVPSRLSGTNPSHRLFQRIIDNDVAALSLAKYTRRFSVSGSHSSNDTAMVFLDAAQHMPRLCELNFHCSNISQTIISKLEDLHELEEIAFRTCSFRSPLSGSTMAQSSKLIRVRNLTLVNAQFSDLENFDANFLRQLSISNMGSDWFENIQRNLLLQHLAITGPFWPKDNGSLFISILSKLSSLKTLRITLRSSRPISEDNIPGDCLPDLDEIEGPWPLCESALQVVQGVRRPMTTLRILGPYENVGALPNPPLENLLRILGQISTTFPLRNLQLPAHYATPESLPVLSEGLPDLHSLGFEIPRGVVSYIDNDSYLRAVRHILLQLHHPTIHTLSFAFWAPSKFKGETFIGPAVFRGLKAVDVFAGVDATKCPSLRWVDFVDVETRLPYLSYRLIDGNWLSLERVCHDAFRHMMSTEDYCATQ